MISDLAVQINALRRQKAVARTWEERDRLKAEIDRLTTLLHGNPKN